MTLPRPALMRHLWVFLVVWSTAVGHAQPADGHLRLAIILSRHGVRSQVATNERIGQYASEPWPTWEVPPGMLTPHGGLLMERMGAGYSDLNSCAKLSLR